MSYNVPNVPGVPALFGGFANPLSGIITGGFTDISALLPVSAAPQWGLFLGGSPVVVADTVTSVDYKQEWVIADCPVERGSFESYDKVARPFDVRLRFAAGGSLAARTALLDSVAAIAGDLNLYTAVTPEVVYQNVNISHFDYRRTNERGRGLLIIDVWGSQIVQSDSGALNNTATPSTADATVGGFVQPTTTAITPSPAPAILANPSTPPQG